MDSDVEATKDIAVDWAVAHGMLLRPPNGSTHSAMHLPFALYPTPYPHKSYDLAFVLMPLFNKLVDNIARDPIFLQEVLEPLSKVDRFVGRIYDVYKKVESEGVLQKVNLGIHRSDYLLHTPLDGSASEPVLQQVELNTIASGMSSLSSVLNQLHRHLEEINLLPQRLLMKGVLAGNDSMEAVPKAIAAALSIYAEKTAIPKQKLVAMMVVQPCERNAFDQRWIEYTLLSSYKIRIIRKTLSEIGSESKLVGDHQRLFFNNTEIAVTYFRAGYGPSDYPTDLEWDARLLIERSFSIKCPTTTYQLIGSKKVQQVLARPGVVERYLDPSEAALVRTSFTGMYALDDTAEGNTAAESAVKDPSRYVMKPSREGGGNNLYGSAITEFLNKCTINERESYILMDFINYVPTKTIMVRNGDAVLADVVSELGTFGIWLSEGDTVYLNEPGGYLMRTKSYECNEGGISAGFAVLDTPLLY
ncbi:glutathione synthase [Cladochytrium replicatum]|nr:glutathione synthase [Cladochytrium replicatum]